MSRKVYECNNSQCGLGEAIPMLQFEKEDHHCPDCGCEMVINVVASMKGINAEKIPDGYEDLLLKANRNSSEGQIKEANFLAGEINNGAY